MYTREAKAINQTLSVYTDASSGLFIEHSGAQTNLMKTILIAEDEASAISLYVAAFSNRPDWKVVVARTGQEALDLAHSLRPSLALLDIRMPVIDGIEVCRQLKASPETSTIPIIFVSALAQPSSRAAAERAGAVGFVSKPFGVKDLLSEIELHIQVKHQASR